VTLSLNIDWKSCDVKNNVYQVRDTRTMHNVDYRMRLRIWISLVSCLS